MSTFEQMETMGHERVCFHHDAATGLRAIIAIHSTALGNALGGTRRWHYATESQALHDVLRLSEGMTYKAAAADLPMGGAKSVILLPNPGAAPSEAKARAMGRFIDTFDGAYIAAEDVGVDPQFVDWMAQETPHAMGGQTISTGGDPSPHTARGTLNAMRATMAHLGITSFDGLRVGVQGVGRVGRHLVRLLVEQGASIVVADIDEQRVHAAVTKFGAKAVGVDEILTIECDVLAPCALGGVIDATMTRKLRCRIVAGAANNILDDPDEDAVALRSQGILYAPDWVANAGGLIHLAGIYLQLTGEERAAKIANIEKTMAQVLRDAESMESTYAAAVALASRRITQSTARNGKAAKEQVHAG